VISGPAGQADSDTDINKPDVMCEIQKQLPLERSNDRFVLFSKVVVCDTIGYTSLRLSFSAGDQFLIGEIAAFTLGLV
jgi:hypothetical protein